MGYDPYRHHRRSTRLKGYDYSRSGYYYVTICTQDREKLFGEIDKAIIRLNEQVIWRKKGRVRDPSLHCLKSLARSNPLPQMDILIV